MLLAQAYDLQKLTGRRKHGKKYFTLSFDDGLEQDKRVIRLMRQYGLKEPSTSMPACLAHAAR